MYLHPLIATLPDSERALLVQSTELRDYRRNDVVLAVDQTSEHVYCVASGLLRVVVHGSDTGSEGVTTDFVSKDDFFFGTSIKEDSFVAQSTLIAALPSSVYLIPISVLRRLCTLFPQVAVGLLEPALKRISMIRGQLRRISSLSPVELVGRVLHELTHLAPAGADGYDKRITQAVIASYAGLSREGVNKAMRELENRGLVRRDDEGVHVPPGFASTDFGALESDAEKHDGKDASRLRLQDLSDRQRSRRGS
ncbi:Crp/Fnr family transcriptional regulator [Variovorax paradoxus]|uniref:Crp/Fnr family transcriptional regulator n=1 Tax=Variovorax paradoxus TaxID=34073 RepID=UPI0019339BD9|nr:Crp/Fnr family transcriptional regulator [Variovorax paradoxus]